MPESIPKPAPGKQLRIFYPVLFAIFPVLAIYSANLALIPLVMIVRPLVVVIALTLVTWLLFGLAFRSIGRGAIGTSLFIAMLFLFSVAQNIGWWLFFHHGHDLWIWGFMTSAFVSLGAWKFTRHAMANFLSLALVCTSVAQICFGYFKSAPMTLGGLSYTNGSGQTVGSRPDILYIILDGYGRSDALQRSLGYDNHAFIEGLESRGFYVAKDSKANYCQTELSVGSSLNLDFIQTIFSSKDVNGSNRMPLGEIINHNVASKYLRQKGYIFGAITTGFPPLQFESADVNMRSLSGMSMIEALLFQMTPLIETYAIESLYDGRRKEIASAIDAIASLKERNLKPRFVIAHILAPHPPFVFGADGQMIRRKGAFGFWDGSDYIQHVSNAADYRIGYVGQAEFIGKEVLKAVDSVLSVSGEKPVILIQGDHGSKLRMDQNSLSKTDVNECFPNLCAVYGPDSVRKSLYSAISPVNLFRVIFNGLFNEKFTTKPDQSWYSTFQLPYSFTDVSNKIADHSEMPSIPLPN